MTKITSEVKEKEPVKSPVNDNEVVTMRELLECGVHFGHQKKRWNPKMDPYIFTTRNGIHVIDLQLTLQLIKETYQVVKDVVKDGGTVLFVGTKKQAQEAIESEALRCDMPYVHNRWLGGLLTNNQTVRQSINKLKKYDLWAENGTMDTYSKKEMSRILKQKEKLRFNLAGIVNMIKLPTLMFVIDTTHEQLAIKEAQKLNISVIGMLDTNANPDDATYPIPSNDDAIRAAKLISSVIANAVIAGQKERLNVLQTPQDTQQESGSSQDIPASVLDSKLSDQKKVSVKKEVEKKSPETASIKQAPKKKVVAVSKKKSASAKVEKKPAKKGPDVSS